jgi:hypothetical protein
MDFSPNCNDRKEWESFIRKFKKQLPEDVFVQVDKRRNINKGEKNIVWKNAPSYPGFDGNVFKKDILDNVCIRHMLYRTNSRSSSFSCEYEHIISHSDCGPSTIENVGLLNAGINRSKSNTALYNIHFYEMKGLCSVFGISFEKLERRLDTDLHQVCLEYNLYFTKNESDRWTVDPIKEYNNQYTDANNVPDRSGYFYNRECLEKWCRRELKRIGVQDNNTVELILLIIAACSICWINLDDSTKMQAKYKVVSCLAYIEKKARSFANRLSLFCKKITYFAYSYTLVSSLLTATLCLTLPVMAMPFACAMIGSSSAIIYVDLTSTDENASKI